VCVQQSHLETVKNVGKQAFREEHGDRILNATQKDGIETYVHWIAAPIS